MASSPEPLELTPAQLARLAAAIFGPPVLICLPRRRGLLWRRRALPSR